MGWTHSKLLPSEIDFVRGIVKQIPSDHGAQDAFLDILNKLGKGEVRWRYLIFTEDCDILGTDDEGQATKANDSNIVVDCQIGCTLNFQMKPLDSIKEWYSHDEDEDAPDGDPNED